MRALNKWRSAAVAADTLTPGPGPQHQRGPTPVHPAQELDYDRELRTSSNSSQPLSGPVSGSGQVLYSVYVHDR